ncbi:ABC transporter substrate-binding protein [Gryllotalpicola protaetiae]|uniref:ABC transporter substrate-binding protein n=1 Tax=Gryllotalpicola protaetiae TaxID=2419771 RepID=A0A387BV41_9MICO|nr:ABC transporter substrate-binding protein [Gryllotalpicola protaetiae]AYG02281.1 ABC transporter substrate-binding protein [Gryllotalpicola protaetiae]
MPPKHPRATSTALLAAATLTVLVLTGCSSPRSTSSSTGSSADLTDTGKSISDVTVSINGAPSSLYPGIAAGILDYDVASLSAEGLVQIGDDGQVEPAVASSWTQPDQQTIVFELNPHAKFQTGAAVTPADVIASIDAAKDPNVSPATASYLGAVDSATQTGDDEVTVKLSSAQPDYLANFSAASALWIYPASYWQSHSKDVGSATALPVGTGPYKITKYVPDSEIDYALTNTWWGETGAKAVTPHAKKITISIITDESARVLAAKSGKTDIALQVPIAQTAEWNALKDFRIEHAADLSYTGFYFQQSVKPFDDPKVREAIGYAFDYQGVVDKLLKGQGKVATAIATPQSVASVYPSAASAAKALDLSPFDFDMKKAKAALKASSVPDGFTTELVYPSDYPQLGQAALALAQNLKTIGITLNVKEEPVDQWFGTLSDGTHGLNYMLYFSTTGDVTDTSGYLLGDQNPGGYKNSEVQSLVASASSSADEKTRVSDILTANKLAIAQDHADIPLWWGESSTAFENGIGIKDFGPYLLTRPWGANIFAAK